MRSSSAEEALEGEEEELERVRLGEGLGNARRRWTRIRTRLHRLERGVLGGPSRRRKSPRSVRPPSLRARTKLTPLRAVKPLPIALEDLYKGTTKKLRITKKRRNGAEEANTLEVVVKPGWKAGTRIKFAGAGHETISSTQVRSPLSPPRRRALTPSAGRRLRHRGEAARDVLARRR